MTETVTGWTVVITRDDWTKFFASGPGADMSRRAFFYRRLDAVAWCKELKAHVSPRCRVVEATLTITTESPT